MASYGPDGEEASWHVQALRRAAALPDRDQPDWIGLPVATRAAVLDPSPALTPTAVRPRLPDRQSRRGISGLIRIAHSSGTNLSGAVSIPATGDWQDWTTVTVTVTLPASPQTLTICQDNGGWNIHDLSFA